MVCSPSTSFGLAFPAKALSVAPKALLRQIAITILTQTERWKNWLTDVLFNSWGPTEHAPENRTMSQSSYLNSEQYTSACCITGFPLDRDVSWGYACCRDLNVKRFLAGTDPQYETNHLLSFESFTKIISYGQLLPAFNQLRLIQILKTTKN